MGFISNLDDCHSCSFGEVEMKDDFMHDRLHQLGIEEMDGEAVRDRHRKTITEIYEYLIDKVIIPVKEYEKLKRLMK